MTAVSDRTQKAKARQTKLDGTYRGVRLQKPVGRSRFSTEQIRRAVEEAIVKHASALARET